MPWTMIAASIGAQLFNSWQANKKTEELQARQREFQKAAQRREFDRMRQLQREAAQLVLEIEADVHKQRLEDIEANYDDVVKQFSTEIAIKKWPLKVLPFVMRGESFGTFFNGSKSIALHTILTPSNCDRFNEAVYMDIDLQLEAACNEHWNAQTSHPIAYYGGAWRKPTLDLDHIDLLKTQLKNVPTVVITPYFGPQLYFKVKMWGMGKDTEVKIELPKNLFSYEYEKGMNYSPKDESPKGDLIDTTIEEFVPYLECLIGYIADTYFWEMYKVVPLLPNIAHAYKNEWNNKLISTFQPIYSKNFIDSISIPQINTIVDIQGYIDYIESIRNFGVLKQMSQIEDALVKHVSDTYAPIQKGVSIPNSYKEIVEFTGKEIDITHRFDWVDNNTECQTTAKYEDRFNIVEYLNQFKKYVEEHTDRFDIETISLYIEHNNYTTFILHTYNAETRKVMDAIDCFDYTITTKRPLYDKKIRGLFKYRNTGCIICRYSRIDKLINEFVNDDTLIF